MSDAAIDTAINATDNPEQRAPRQLPATAGAALRALFRHPSPTILAILAVTFVVLRIYLGNWSYADLIAPLVLLAVWPFWEWAIHVFLLHYKPRTVFGRTIDLTLPKKHRRHHQNPWDHSLIFIHLGVYPVVVPILLWIAWASFPTIELATGALAAFFILAFNYEWTHFLAHIDWCPPLEYYRRRVRMHRLHHFRHEQLWWGVSMGFGDTVLGTAPDVNTVERSPTADNLHGLARQG